ncbi:uncharacterized protein LOC126786972 [Argentina anserina]|uniref:uncharacterized protein LOC126786972 n=1 Tax=Argentina anserina TaxID=57926 RepID=UPI0021762ED0|nr:uncharacterized protein LOC126786972 [Potentilla anserina]
MASKARSKIREDIGDSKFCIIVDEACDESKREQMVLFLRFINREGYDGARNMRGKWKRLQALFLNDCPYAYYVHYFAHRLQLALVAASREVIHIHQFFSHLSSIINVVASSCKRHDQLQDAQVDELAHLLSIDELESGKGANQEIMGITNARCQALQQKNQDISNAMHLVFYTKKMIQNLREDGWVTFLDQVVSFSNKFEVDVLDLDAPYFEGQSRRRKRDITLEHHFHFDIFVAAIDAQLQELDCRFGESALELLTLSSGLDPRNSYNSFNIDVICLLVEKYYPFDFTEQEKIDLRYQLSSFKIDVHNHPVLQSLSSIPELCRKLDETKRASKYYLFDRLIRLVLTLPVSTTTGERAFSTMKIIKTRLRNKMEDDFLADNLVVYIEREIVKTFTSNCIPDEFTSMKEYRVLFK